MSPLIRIAALLGLIGAVAYGGWQLNQEPVDRFEASGEELLRDRFLSYVDLRKNDDWVAIYDMVDPYERRDMDLGGFLGVYGQGVMKTHEITARDLDINSITRRARVTVTTEAELVVSKLPAQYRNSLKVEDPAELKRTMDHAIGWVWRGDNWYFSLEEEVMQGQTADGQAISPLPSSSSS